MEFKFIRFQKQDSIARITINSPETMNGYHGAMVHELLEAITLKRLGLYLNPIVLVNTRGFFAPLLTLLERAVEERFMDTRHLTMWQVVDTPDEVPAALATAPEWTADARSFAAV